MASAGGDGAPKLKILVMNTGGKGSVEHRVEHRREAIKEVVNKVSADVIFLQEAKSEDRSAVGYTEWYGNNEASVMVNREGRNNESDTAYKETQIHMTKTSQRGKGGKGGNRDIPSFELSRVASCVFDGKIVCVSWHSRHTGIKDGSKTNSLKALLDYIQRIKGDLPFILGGDFNIESHKVRDFLTSKFKKDGLKLYDADDIYEEKVMVIASWELVAQRELRLHGQKDLPKDDRYLDHLQLELEFSIYSNNHLHSVPVGVSEKMRAVLIHTLLPQGGPAAESRSEREITRAERRHLSSVAPLFRTTVDDCIKTRSDLQESIQCAYEIVDVTERIFEQYIKIPAEEFKECKNSMEELENEVKKMIVDKTDRERKRISAKYRDRVKKKIEKKMTDRLNTKMRDKGKKGVVKHLTDREKKRIAEIKTTRMQKKIVEHLTGIEKNKIVEILTNRAKQSIVNKLMDMFEGAVARFSD